jgi:hypothetical protein
MQFPRVVIPHRGARIGVTGSDLRVAQVNASVKHCRDISVAQRMCPGGLDASGLGEVLQAAGGRVPVHPGAAAVGQDRPARAASDRPVDGPADCWRQRHQDDLWPGQ